MIDTVVFDLGGVLIDWNPRYLYRKLLKNENEIEFFLREICDGSWNEKQDAGRPFAEGIAELTAKHPEKTELIEAYFSRWSEMLAGPIFGSVEILHEIYRGGRHRLFALSNWSAETFPIALARFEFLASFADILVSGREKMVKPDPRFFSLLSARHGTLPDSCLFIDDVEKNLNGAADLGFHTLLFTSPEQLRDDLSRMGILDRFR